MKIKLIVSFCLFFSITLSSQIDTVWTRCLGGSSDEAIGFGAGFSGSPYVSLVVDEFGNSYVASYSNSTDGIFSGNAGSEDVVLLKLNAAGELVWSQTYGGSDVERCHQMILLNDGNVLLCGRTLSASGTLSSTYGSEDGFLLKISPEGQVVWSRSYGGSLLDYIFGVKEIPNSNGDLIAYGMTGSIDGIVNDASYIGSNKAWIMRLNSLGDVIWSRKTNALNPSEDWEEAFYFAAFSANNNSIFLQGASYNFNDINSDDIFICEYLLNGTIGDKHVYGGSAGDSPAGIAVLEDETVVFASVIRGGGNNVSNYQGGGADGWLTCINSEGSILWDKSIGGTNLDYLYDLKLTSEGLLLSGSTRSTDVDAARPIIGGLDCFVVFASPANGDTLKTIRWGSTANDNAHSSVIMDDGTLVSAGRTVGNDAWVHGNSGGTDLYITYFESQTTTSVVNASTKDKFVIYPNPATNKIYISHDAITSNDMPYAIYTATGKIVKQGVFKRDSNLNSIQIEIPGVYFIKTDLGVRKFIVLND